MGSMTTSHLVRVEVEEPWAELEGGAERHLEEGSRILLVCRLASYEKKISRDDNLRNVYENFRKNEEIRFAKSCCKKANTHFVTTLIKKRRNFPHIRKFRREQLQRPPSPPRMTKYLRISSYIKKPFLIYDFATASSEFPYI
jgi:hypothetical protein